jgi:transglutaminase-like putative cysteine protease
MQFRLGCELGYHVSSSATFLFQICTPENPHQKIIEERLLFNPSLDFDERLLTETGTRLVRVTVEPGDFFVSYEAKLDLSAYQGAEEEAGEVPISRLPLEIFPYLYPSRYCPSDELIHLAEAEFGNATPGFERVKAICDWIHRQISYVPGASDSHTSVLDTLIQRAGVCRDFAHLGIALCRALGIPARFVSVYAHGLPQPDFHACFEAYLGERWYLFDATRLAPTTGFLRIGHGRDAADISFATIFGEAEMTTFNTFVTLLSEDAPAWTSKPYSFI